MKTIKACCPWVYVENTQKKKKDTWAGNGVDPKGTKWEFLKLRNLSEEIAVYFGSSVKHTHARQREYVQSGDCLYLHILHTTNQTFKETWFHCGLRLI